MCIAVRKRKTFSKITIINLSCHLLNNENRNCMSTWTSSEIHEIVLRKVKHYNNVKHYEMLYLY